MTASTSNTSHWYELNPTRFEMEKMAMAQLFPDFKLSEANGGQLIYSGTLNSDSFKRPEGYSINVEYYDSGPENFGNPGIVITPVSPTFNELFPDSFCLSKTIKSELLNQVAIDMKCVCYEDPITTNIATITTGATLLYHTLKWYEGYENAINQARNYYINSQNFIALKKFDYRTAIFGYYRFSPSEADYHNSKRKQLREFLRRGVKVKLSNQRSDISYNQWWTNPDKLDDISNVLLQTFPQLKFRLEEEPIKYLCGYAVRYAIEHNEKLTQPVLYIEGTIHPSIYFDISCSLKLIYRNAECNIYLDLESTNKLCKTIGCLPFPLNIQDGHLFNARCEHPLRMILLVLRWFNDIEDVIMTKMSNISFYEIYKKYSVMSSDN